MKSNIQDDIPGWMNLKPEALKSNIHGYIRGKMHIFLINHGVVEEV